MRKLIISKQLLLKLTDDLSEEVNIYEFIELVTIHAKIEMARDQFAKGEFLTSEELDREIDSWN